MEKVKAFFNKLLGQLAGQKKKLVATVVAGALLTFTLLQTGVVNTLADKLRPSTAASAKPTGDADYIPVIDDTPSDSEPIEEVEVVADGVPLDEPDECPDGAFTLSKPDGEFVGCISTNK